MLVFFKLLYTIGLLGIAIQFILQIFTFIKTNFSQVLSLNEQINLQINKTLEIFFSPFFWILFVITIIGYLGTKKYRNNLSI